VTPGQHALKCNRHHRVGTGGRDSCLSPEVYILYSYPGPWTLDPEAWNVRSEGAASTSRVR
jgi:hypothetical protein